MDYLNHFIMLLLILGVTIILNIRLRQQRYTIAFKNKYITNRFLLALLIIPTKRKIFLSGYLHYAFQLLAFVILLCLYAVDWIRGNNYFFECVWVYIYLVLTIIIPPFFSGLLDKGNNQIP